ncbi:MAG: DNA polymerase III subunit delta' [candidate division FCPU426 bacterium]
MPFNAVWGQPQAVDFLRRAVSQGRAAHAYLFSGPEGVGKRTTALALAQALNCLQPQAGDACGECAACRKIAAAGHPDVVLLEPEGQALKIDQVRETLQRNLRWKPLEGRCKAFILDEADALTTEAANSLLKALEEPPDAVVIVLITSQPFALLPTIRSRCQEVRFRPLDTGLLAQWLSEQHGLPSETAASLARLSDGRPAEALRLSDPEVQALRSQVLEVAAAAQPEAWPELAAAMSEWQGAAVEPLVFLLTWFRDLLVLASGVSPRLAVNQDRLAQLRAALSGKTPETLWDQCRLVLQALDWKSQNLNLQLLLERMWMKLLPRTGAGAR